ncbi:RAD51-associated protein 1 isoform X1 [Oryzias latipes]|uniref:RAD51 associated protein 1 n=1 Tax=Oryzias latipes TaxID=8090 RepID=H2MM66_ORYLA|nr:RAD51-associated protein 1 isoform X1 [Oryzias latipes]
MDRPSRKTKVVNYSEAKDFEDDEDFASVKAPPHKKAKEEVKQQQRKSSSQEVVSESSQKEKIRKPLDEKLYDRDLEAAITLSLLNNTDGLKESSPKADGKIQIPMDENTDPTTLRFSNCSVDGAVLGLDAISSEIRSSASKKTSSKTAEVKKCKDDDDDYQPKLTPDPESDEDFSEPSESEDEEFTVKKPTKTQKKDKVSPKDRIKPAPTSKKVKQPSKTKPEAAAASKPVKSPPTSKPTPTRPPSTKPASSLSPAAGKVPKWNPPAQIGKSASSSHSPPVKSPSQGLRLGLSRLVRVKPLHPSVASH